MKLSLYDLIQKFNYDPNSVKKNYDGKTDIYLAKVSYRYGYFKRIAVIVLIALVIMCILFGNISYSKLYYLTKDIKLANDYVNSVHDTITYNVGNSQSFALYRGGLAVASRERLSIFSAGGRELFSSNHSYGNPALEVSNKYVLLYDVGGKQFSLYNAFSKAREETLDYGIFGADIAQNGTFALITKSEKFDSVVSVYLQNGTKYDYSYSDGRVTEIALSDNGSVMVVALTFTNGERLNTELRLYKVGSKDYKKADLTFDGVPFAIDITDSGNVIAVGAKGVNSFNQSLGFVGEYLPGEQIYAYCFGEDNIAIVHSNDNGSRSEVVLLNKRARVEREYDLESRIINVAYSDGSIFLQKIDGFEKINVSLNSRSKIDMIATDFSMISCDKDTLIVCNDSYARFLYFN